MIGQIDYDWWNIFAHLSTTKTSQFNTFSSYLCKYNWQKDHTYFFADFIFFKVGIVGVFQEKVGKCRNAGRPVFAVPREVHHVP